MTPLERAASAIQAEMRRQDVLYEHDGAKPDLSKLMMGTGEAADLELIVRAVLQALREPSEAMQSAGEGMELCESFDTTCDYTHARIDEACAGNVWRAMIDAALEEG